jgi:hypothetical protein
LHQRAVGEHDLHAALHCHVVAIGGVADAMFQGVRQHTAPTGRGAVDPQFAADLLQVTIQIEIAHARFDDRIAMLFIDFENPVHTLEVKHDVPWLARCRAAIGKVLASGNGPQRRLVMPRHLENPPQLLNVGRRHRRRRLMHFRRRGLVGIDVGRDFPFRVGKHIGLADNLLQIRHQGGEMFAGYSRR